jgi:hypothetical protein
MTIGWDDPACARYYEAFCAAHDRYALASRELVSRAALDDCRTVVDLAAGTGRTAEAIVTELGPDATLWCVEPAAAMRSVGQTRVSDARVRWVADLDRVPTGCDRVVCSAALWAMTPVLATLKAVRHKLHRGGLFLFNVPALYLGEPDEPGDGPDPHLLELPAMLYTGRAPTSDAPVFSATASDIERWLEAASYRSERWSFRYRFTQSALRDWMKIPVLTNALLGELDADARAARIDAVSSTLDPSSFRWERWICWRAEAI